MGLFNYEKKQEMVDFKEKVQSFFFMKNTEPAHCCTLCTRAQNI